MERGSRPPLVRPARWCGRISLPLGFGSASRGRCCLIGHLLHVLAHSRNMTGRAVFVPGFVTLRRFFQMREEGLVDELLASLRDDGLDTLPNPEKLAACLKEEIFVQ